MSPTADVIDRAPPTLIRRAERAEVRRSNVLIGTQRTVEFTWAGAPAALRFSPAAPGTPPVDGLQIRLGAHVLGLAFAELPEPANLGVDFAGIELNALPDELRLGVLEACLHGPIDALRHIGVTVALEPGPATAGPNEPGFGWELVRNQERFWAGTLHGDTAALDFIADLVSRTQPKPAPAADALPFPVQIAVSHLRLPLGALREIAQGDVLLPALLRADWEQGRCELWSGPKLLGQGIRQKQTVKILAMKVTTEAPPPSAAVPAAALRVDELPVPVVFDVGQIELTVGQLRTVGEGYTFELPAVPDRLVTIRANGREIGQGELVDLGDKLGVRITQWSLA